MSKDEFIKINVALRVPADVANKAITLSREINEQHSSLFVIDDVNWHVHITVYPIECPRENFDDILKEIDSLSKELKKVNLVFKQPGCARGFIAVDFELSPEVKNLHEKIIERINPLRGECIRDKYKKSLEQPDIPEEKKENILKYGYPNLLSLYNPHLTITRLEDEILAEKVAKNLKWEIPSFTVDKVAVLKSGEHGTCREVIKEFSLR